MRTISSWISAIVLSFGCLFLLSYLEDGYQDERFSAGVMNEAIIETQAEYSLNNHELHQLIAEAGHMLD